MHVPGFEEVELYSAFYAHRCETRVYNLENAYPAHAPRTLCCASVCQYHPLVSGTETSERYFVHCFALSITSVNALANLLDSIFFCRLTDRNTHRRTVMVMVSRASHDYNELQLRWPNQP